MVIGFYILAF